ncbi:MAG: hypothetical protein KF734_02285 [Saprospiraceae bacterium]|nr:hypothetical protein [Saprospiraceae bacterium]
MQIKFFTIPVMGGEALAEELNAFFRPAWCFHQAHLREMPDRKPLLRRRCLVRTPSATGRFSAVEVEFGLVVGTGRCDKEHLCGLIFGIHQFKE